MGDKAVTTILVTGASGFVGRYLCTRLLNEGFHVKGVIRDKSYNKIQHVRYEQFVVDEIGKDTNWENLLDCVDRVIHLAARVHIIHETSVDNLAAFRQINTEGTEQLAKMCVTAGVDRFVYVSTIKVNGEITDIKPFNDQDIPNPSDPYAISKWEAENILRKIADESEMEVVIVRPPLIYGPGVKGNMLRLLKLIDKGLPLPLANANNLRSMIGLENFSDFLKHCTTAAPAANQTFTISDQDDQSTADLSRKLADMLGRNLYLFPIPLILLRAVAAMIGKSGLTNRLFGNLQVDSTRASKLLEWTPPLSVDEGLKKMVQDYQYRNRKNQP